jgi:hypothetical protein
MKRGRTAHGSFQEAGSGETSRVLSRSRRRLGTHGPRMLEGHRVDAGERLATTLPFREWSRLTQRSSSRSRSPASRLYRGRSRLTQRPFSRSRSPASRPYRGRTAAAAASVTGLVAMSSLPITSAMGFAIHTADGQSLRCRVTSSVICAVSEHSTSVQGGGWPCLAQCDDAHA